MQNYTRLPKKPPVASVGACDGSKAWLEIVLAHQRLPSPQHHPDYLVALEPVAHPARTAPPPCRSLFVPGHGRRGQIGRSLPTVRYATQSLGLSDVLK